MMMMKPHMIRTLSLSLRVDRRRCRQDRWQLARSYEPTLAENKCVSTRKWQLQANYFPVEQNSDDDDDFSIIFIVPAKNRERKLIYGNKMACSMSLTWSVTC